MSTSAAVMPQGFNHGLVGGHQVEARSLHFGAAPNHVTAPAAEISCSHLAHLVF